MDTIPSRASYACAYANPQSDSICYMHITRNGVIVPADFPRTDPMSYKVIKTKNGFDVSVDESDFEYVSQFRWYARQNKRQRTHYAYAYLKSRITPMHRLLMKPSGDQEVDHRDGNGLNNQRINLRVCTRQQNCRNKQIAINNRTGVRGVHFDKEKRKFRAMIGHEKRVIHIGYFSDIEAAKAAYTKTAKQLFGEFHGRIF